MRPDDVGAYASVGDPQMHPDGVRVAFVVSRANLDEDRYDSEIWLWDGEAAARFTHGPVDSRPRWSPDGATLAFIRGSTDKDAAAQLAIMPSARGEATISTAFDRGVSEAEWSPDGRSIAVIATEWAPDWAGIDREERARRPRRITGPEWRHDGVGFQHDTTRTAVVVHLDTGSQTTISPPGTRPSSLVWCPDGTAVGFLASTHERSGFDGGNQPFRARVDGGEPVALAGVGAWEGVSFRPDGVAHAIGVADLEQRPAPPALYRLDPEGPVRLAPELDRDVTPQSGGLQWSDDGSCLVLVQDAGMQVVVAIDADGDHREVAAGRRQITGISCVGGDTMAMTVSTPTDPGELVIASGGEETVVTAINAEFRRTADLRPGEHLTVTRDGFDLDVWVYLPHGDGPFPTLFNIHGGPMAQYGWGFFDEFQVEVGAGYAVVATNPRGASGRGDEFMKGEVGTWSHDRPPDALDLLAALDGALDHVDQLDSGRLGIMGGSYGGLISSKILSFDHRFKSAVPERGLYNFVSFAGTSDIGLWFDTLFVGERDHGDWTPLWDASPLRTAHLIRTPCLVIHSDADWRCPIEQGEQLFATLLANGVEAEFLRFPGEGHELSRSGSPRHRVERLDAILDWHGRHL